MSNHINEILFALTDAEVEFIVGGGVAAVLHGVERVIAEKGGPGLLFVDLDRPLRHVEIFLQVTFRLGS